MLLCATAAGSQRAGQAVRRALEILFVLVLVVPLSMTMLGLFSDNGVRGRAEASLGFGGSVVGFLIAAPVAGGDDRQEELAGDDIYVPNVAVVLEEVATGRRSDQVLTDLSGRFTFPEQQVGTYRVCWAASGFTSSCGAPFGVSREHIHLGHVRIRPDRGAGTTTFAGQARLLDGSTARMLHPIANVNAFVKVTAVDNAGARVAGPAHVNNYGEYILPSVPSSAARLVARIEKLGTTAPAVSSPNGFRRVDFRLKNSNPRFIGISADPTGTGRRWTAQPGAPVRMVAQARDPNGDRVFFRWILPDGTSSNATTAAITYPLPNLQRTFQFEVVAYDRKGGYARDVVLISTAGVRFSGVVSGTNAPILAGAVVEVNGRNATTDATGRFQLTIPEASRYVLNIRKPGYGLVSRIYDRGVIGGSWIMTRASVATVDPTKPISVVNSRIPSDCPGALRPARQAARDCAPGISVQLPAGALVDAQGRPPRGPVQVELATVDPRARDSMPGDWTSRVGSARRVMETYGAGSVVIRSRGRPLRLRPGVRGRITIPIDPAQLAPGGPIPRRIPFLSYDERRGIWVQEGLAQRVGNGYVATIQHLSSFNVDTQFQNQACVRVDAVGMRSEFFLRAEIPSNSGGAPRFADKLIVNTQQRFHILYNAAPNTTIKLSAFEKTSSGGVGAQIQLALPGATTGLELSVNTGGPQAPPTPNPPDFPYTACKGFSGATPGPLPSAILVEARLPSNVATQFLQGFRIPAENLTADPTKTGPWEASANAYYKRIDPHNFRGTLAGFRSRNGFPAGEVVAAYANSADLGFGREMHCRRAPVAGLLGFDVSCYVTNYGNKDTDDVDDFKQALNAKQTGVPTGAIATVGMEFSRVENAADSSGNTFESNTRVVKFYVWDGGGNRIPSADLDGFGARPVPQLCMTCHGGRYPNNLPDKTDGTKDWAASPLPDLHANFIAFDLRGFELATVAGVDHKADQQDEFKKLNEEMVLSSEPSQAIRDVIAQMYSGTNPNIQDEASRVAGWNGTNAAGGANQPQVYADVIAQSCRTCHMSQGDAVTPSQIEWDDAATTATRKFGISGFVCSSHVMPHALITHRRFWLTPSPYQPVRLADWLDSLAPPANLGANCRP